MADPKDTPKDTLKPHAYESDGRRRSSMFPTADHDCWCDGSETGHAPTDACSEMTDEDRARRDRVLGAPTAKEDRSEPPHGYWRECVRPGTTDVYEIWEWGILIDGARVEPSGEAESEAEALSCCWTHRSDVLASAGVERLREELAKERAESKHLGEMLAASGGSPALRVPEEVERLQRRERDLEASLAEMTRWRDEALAMYQETVDADSHAPMIERLRKVAREHGYALAVHGSLVRDIDLLAAPWVEEASSPGELAEALRVAAEGVFATTTRGDPQPEGARPHGRRSWAIGRQDAPYIDLSVMPTQAALRVGGGRAMEELLSAAVDFRNGASESTARLGLAAVAYGDALAEAPTPPGGGETDRQRLIDCIRDAFAWYCRDNPDPDQLPADWAEEAQDILGGDEAEHIYDYATRGATTPGEPDNWEPPSQAIISGPFKGRVVSTSERVIPPVTDESAPPGERRGEVVDGLARAVAQDTAAMDNAGAIIDARLAAFSDDMVFDGDEARALLTDIRNALRGRATRAPEGPSGPPGAWKDTTNGMEPHTVRACEYTGTDPDLLNHSAWLDEDGVTLENWDGNAVTMPEEVVRWLLAAPTEGLPEGARCIIQMALQYVEGYGECEGVEPDEHYCEAATCDYCDLARLLQEHAPWLLARKGASDV